MITIENGRLVVRHPRILYVWEWGGLTASGILSYNISLFIGKNKRPNFDSTIPPDDEIDVVGGRWDFSGKHAIKQAQEFLTTLS